MSGFNISIGSIGKISKSRETQTNEQDFIAYKDIRLNNFFHDKFENDNLFLETNDYIIVLKGVILNKKALSEPSINWKETITALYLKVGNDFFKKLRGSFCGALYDKKKDKWLVFTDHIGSRALYYYKKGRFFFISSFISEIYSFLKDHNLSYSLNIESAYNLLSYGYMLGDETLCDDIYKIMPGNYLCIQDGSVEMINYYKLPKSKLDGDVDEDEIIEKLDINFREAIRLQFEKDREYSYKHFVALSGGLDSRMTSWVAHQMGYVDQVNLTFSQSDYLDETIPKKIAADLRHEWIFKALDNGTFLKDIDEINIITGGNVLYYGLSHSNSLIKYLNNDKLGLFHSGQLGGPIIGSYIKRLNRSDLKSLGGRFSKKLGDKNTTNKSFGSFEDLELAMLYQRGFNGLNEWHKIAQIKTETMSPFYNVDFMEYCLSIPIKNRMNHRIYLKWISSKYPEAANYKWEKINAKPTANHFSVTYKGNQILLKKLPSLIVQKLGLKSPPRYTKNHMNPLEYWYNTNNDLRAFLDNYFEENIDRISNRGLNSDCQKLYNSGNATEKNQVLTLLSALKLHF